MKTRNRFRFSLLTAMTAALTISCGSMAPKTAATVPTAKPTVDCAGASSPTTDPTPALSQTPCPPAVAAAPPPSKPVRIPVLVVPDRAFLVPKDSRIVIADIEGDCAEEVKDALMRRLIDNRDYSVLTRDNLQQLIGEATETWSGKFNTETAARLGELMGASLWIVGRVAYCGQSFSPPDDDEEGPIFSVVAALQIIELQTGKVLVSSSSSGKYRPQRVASFDFKDAPAQTGGPKPVPGRKSSNPRRSRLDKSLRKACRQQ